MTERGYIPGDPAEVAHAQATADNARQMVMNRDPRLESLEAAVGAADTAHAAIDASIQAERQAREDADNLTRSQTSAALLDKVGVIAVGTGRLGIALLLGGSTDVTVTLSKTMPSTAYVVELAPTSGMTLTVKNKTTTTVVVTVTAGLALSLGSTFTLLATL